MLDAGSPKNSNGNTKVFFGNLPWRTSWQDLKDLVKNIGLEPGYVDVIKDKKSGRSRGFGLASFASPEDAVACIEKLNNTTIEDRQIYVKSDRPRNEYSRGNNGPGDRDKKVEKKKNAYIETQETSSDEKKETSVMKQIEYNNELEKPPVATSGRVFVGNLSWSVKWKELVAHMEQAGEVNYAEILTGMQGRSMGAALVEFKTKEQAQTAIDTLFDIPISGRKIYLREDRETYWTVFVSQISRKMTWQELKDLCSVYGKVVRSDRNDKGYGTVRFESKEDAQACVDGLNGKEYEGQTLRVMFANQARKFQRAAEYADDMSGQVE